MIEKGSSTPLGSTPDSGGTNFALYSAGASEVELCFFDAAGNESHRQVLPGKTGLIWHGYVSGCGPGQSYGYRVHGRYSPMEGLRFNPHKLLIDPYAKLLRGEFAWNPAVFDFVPHQPRGNFVLNEIDSAPFVPKSVVVDVHPPLLSARPNIPWAQSIIYETNVRGYTMRHPDVPELDQGTFRGMRNGQVLEYLISLGVTSVELMPVQAFIDEQFLHKRGLRNFWGYNSISFFAPASRYLGGDDANGFREMVDVIHDAGLEVLLDVAYNHTGESDTFGPSLSFRGIDNLSYYRTAADNPGEYINDTGCGNTINTDTPAVRQLILDSLLYWHDSMGVDGFRFDLATILGRGPNGFRPDHEFLQELNTQPKLGQIKLIAEPWDPGPGGYQLGNFPKGWSEWNDRYRDSVRRFWRGEHDQASELAKRLHGSSDLLESSGRGPAESINFVTSHDGFTLADTVSFEQRHNLANGEENRDGHAHNFSSNNGHEGPTADLAIQQVRRRQRLNMLATLLLSKGTPMLLAGDEFGNSQNGNNNAYAQDNETTWLDWDDLATDLSFAESVKRLIQIRQQNALLHDNRYRHGNAIDSNGWPDIQWLNPVGNVIEDADWQSLPAFSLINTDTVGELPGNNKSVAILVNAGHREIEFELPDDSSGHVWQMAFSSDEHSSIAPSGKWRLAPLTIACLTLSV